MTINTKKVSGRRDVRYESYADLLADAERVAAADNVQMLGNWSLGQIYKHLAMALDSSIDGVGFSLPAPARWLMTLLMKRRFLTKSVPAGFKTTKEFTPGETSAEEGLSALRAAIARQDQQQGRCMHPAFGKLSDQEWMDFNLRHAEMHMSFAVPE